MEGKSLSKDRDSFFKGKRALVTGGSRGIGFDIAKGLYRRGAQVIVLGKNPANSDHLKQEMPLAETVCVDLADWKLTEEAIKSVQPVDLLVNNAGIANAVTPVWQTMEADFDSVFAVNIKSVFNVSRLVAADLIARRVPGSIVNVSSTTSSLCVSSGSSVYGASKAALDSLTRSMALELGQFNIRVNSVNPQITLTEMGKDYVKVLHQSPLLLGRTPLGRYAELSEITSAVLFLLSNDASYITGTILPLDGGLCVNGFVCPALEAKT